MYLQKLLKKLPLGKMTTIEFAVIGLFILYLVLPIETPEALAMCVDSSLGMLVVFVLAVVLFMKSNSILAVLFIFVAFEKLKYAK